MVFFEVDNTVEHRIEIGSVIGAFDLCTLPTPLAKLPACTDWFKE
jgi:hypothetical protein